MKKLKLGALALSLAFGFTACSSDDSSSPAANHGTLKIAANASYGDLGSRTTSSVNENITLSSFMINIEEIELEFADDYEGLGNYYDSDDDIELKGPFEYDLLSGESFDLVDIVIPNGVFEEIEFEFDKSKNPDSELFGKSMLLKGEINGVPFVFWHDFEEEIEIDYEDAEQNLVIDNNTLEVAIHFNLNAVLSAVDLTTATDNDGDGVITISPSDEDGNNALARALKEAIKDQIELMEDMYDLD